MELTESRGIDILGNIVESSVISANKNLYGDLHNLGHVAIALCHDPENKNLVRNTLAILRVVKKFTQVVRCILELKVFFPPTIVKLVTVNTG